MSTLAIPVALPTTLVTHFLKFRRRSREKAQRKAIGVGFLFIDPAIHTYRDVVLAGS